MTITEWYLEGETQSIRSQPFSQCSYSNHRSHIDWLGIKPRALKSERQPADSSRHDAATTILNLFGTDGQVITADITWCRNVFKRILWSCNLRISRTGHKGLRHPSVEAPIKTVSTYADSQYFSGDKIEKNEMGGASSAYGGEERRVQGFGGVTWGKEATWETQA